MSDLVVIAAEPLRAFTREIFQKAGLAGGPGRRHRRRAGLGRSARPSVARRDPHSALYRLDRLRPHQRQCAAQGGAEKGALAKIDGEGAAGPAAMSPAVDVAIAQAREHAAAWVLVQDHTHAGAIGFYA